MSATSDKVKPINYISAKAQEHLYKNKEFSGGEIPTVVRNYDSGWPLIQISSFERGLSDQHEPIFKNWIAGGKCQDIHMGAFSLGKLLVEAPRTKKAVFKGNNKEIALDKLELINQPMFDSTFSIVAIHKRIKYKISQRTIGYGKRIDIKREINKKEYDYSPELVKALTNINNHAFLASKKLILKDGFHNTSKYTESEVCNSLNREFAVFHNGQIYVDLGKLMSEYNVKEEVVDFFAYMFRVNEFNKVKETTVNNSDIEQSPTFTETKFVNDNDFPDFSSSSSSDDSSLDSVDDFDNADTDKDQNRDTKASPFKLSANKSVSFFKLQRTQTTNLSNLSENKNNFRFK